MKTLIFTFTLLLGLSGKVFAQWHYHLNYEQTYGGLLNQSNGNPFSGKKVIIAKDREIISTASIIQDTSMHLPFKSNQVDVYIQKSDSLGYLLWQKIIGSTKSDANPNLFATNDSGFVLMFQSNGNDSDITCYYPDTTSITLKINNSIQILKFDSDGNIQNRRCFGSNNAYTNMTRAILTQDNGFLIYGNCSYLGNATGDKVIIKLDSLLTEQWHYCIPAGSVNSPCISEAQDGSFFYADSFSDSLFLGTHIHYNSTSSSDIVVIKFGASGNLIWVKALGSFGTDVPNAIIPTKSGGCVFTGYVSLNNSSIDTGDVIGYHASSDIWTVELDSLGNIKFQICIGGASYDEGFSIIRKPDGGYFVGGYSSNSIIFNDTIGLHGLSDYYIVDLDSNLQYLGSHCFGGSLKESCSDLVLHPNGSLWAWGETKSHDGDVTLNHGMSDLWLIQLVPDTILGIQIAASKTNNKISVYPNPAHNAFTINYSSTYQEGSSITLYDVLGNDLLEQKLITATTTISTGQLSNGVYLYKIATADGVLKRGKIVVEK